MSIIMQMYGTGQWHWRIQCHVITS